MFYYRFEDDSDTKWMTCDLDRPTEEWVIETLKTKEWQDNDSGYYEIIECILNDNSRYYAIGYFYNSCYDDDYIGQLDDWYFGTDKDKVLESHAKHFKPHPYVPNRDWIIL